jgi:hypothetical protein
MGPIRLSTSMGSRCTVKDSLLNLNLKRGFQSIWNRSITIEQSCMLRATAASHHDVMLWMAQLCAIDHSTELPVK